MTIFDFDDACYFWFMYELACAWEGGIGRTMFRPLDKRRAFMDHYMEQVLEGYNRENSLSAEWLERLPLFLKVIQMEEFLHYVQYLDGPDEEIQAGLNYKRRCIEEDIPYLGFFRSHLFARPAFCAVRRWHPKVGGQLKGRGKVMDTPDEYMVAGETGKKLDDNLSPFIQNVIRSHELPGLAIGVVADNEIVYARGWGVKRIETRDPVSMTTVFHMASISKPFVATAIAQLLEQGRVRLDAPVVTYLPYFKLDDDRYRDITVQQMLSHVSGMPDVTDYEWGTPQYDEGALERYVRSLSSKKLISEPGEKFAYSNMAFECLGDVIAKVSGMSFDDYVKRHILDPAGMAESSFLKPEHLPGNWAAPHVRVLTSLAWAGYPYNRMHGPSSTLHSSALEMCYWAIVNLNRGQFRGSRILSPSSYDLLWQPRAQAGEGRQVGLSWFLGEYRGEKTVEHGGGDIGFNTYFVMLPDKRAAVAVLCNLIPAPVEKIAHSALDILLGYEPPPSLPMPVSWSARHWGRRGWRRPLRSGIRSSQTIPTNMTFLRRNSTTCITRRVWTGCRTRRASLACARGFLPSPTSKRLKTSSVDTSLGPQGYREGAA